MTGTCELNIRLDAIDLFDDPVAIERRADAAVAMLQRFGAVAHRRVVAGSAHKLVVLIQAGDVTDDVLHKLAENLHQDCIAIYFPTRETGQLVGPRAGRWGQFSVADFERYEPLDSTEFAAGFLQGVKPKHKAAAKRKTTGETQIEVTSRQQLEASGFKTVPKDHWIYSEGASSHFSPATRGANGQDETKAEPVAQLKPNSVAVRLLAELANSMRQDERISADDVGQLIELEHGEQVDWVSSTWMAPDLVNLFTCGTGAEPMTVVATRHGHRGVLVGIDGPWNSTDDAKDALGEAPEGWSDV